MAYRVLGSLQCLRALSERIFCLVDLVKIVFIISAVHIKFYQYPITRNIINISCTGIVTRRPLVLQLHRIEEGSREYAEFGHLPRKRFTDFGELLDNIYYYSLRPSLCDPFCLLRLESQFD